MKFYIRVDASKSDNWRDPIIENKFQIEARKVKTVDWLKTIIHYSTSRYYKYAVTDTITGLTIAYGHTQCEAISSAVEKLEKYGKDDTLKIINGRKSLADLPEMSKEEFATHNIPQLFIQKYCS